MGVQSLGWEDPLWRRAQQPAPVFLPGEWGRQRNPEGTVHRVAKLQTQLQRLSTNKLICFCNLCLPPLAPESICRGGKFALYQQQKYISIYMLVNETLKFTPLSTHGNLRSDYLFKRSLKFHKISKSRRVIVSWDYLFTYYLFSISLSPYIYILYG